MTRTQLEQHQIEDHTASGPIGALLVLETSTDPHSPVMYDAYDHLVQYLEDRVPLAFTNANYLTPELRADLLIFSAPTLLWLIHKDDRLQTAMRVVGIVNKKKLEKEAMGALSLILNDQRE